ncbi:MAG: DNA alkylation repair protein [Chloroflexota bacterium]
MQSEDIINKIKSLHNPEAVAGMARFGINPDNNYGVSVTELRKMAKEIGTNHNLAMQLWQSGIHEARIMACLIDDPKLVTEEQMQNWVMDFDSWDICDQCCSNLFRKTEYARQKVFEWSSVDEEFVKRAGFVLMAVLAVHDKKADDSLFEHFLPVIKAGADDGRNFVRKAVNWALRQTGKRNLYLNSRALETAKEIQQIDAISARWIASDAIRELTSQAVQDRLKARNNKNDKTKKL